MSLHCHWNTLCASPGKGEVLRSPPALVPGTCSPQHTKAGLFQDVGPSLRVKLPLTTVVEATLQHS